jgi:putative selenate reductase
LQCAAFCDKCVEVCPNRANYAFTMDPVDWSLPVLADVGGRVSVSGYEAFRIVQHRQILHVDDFCNECDNCQTFCVHQGKPYHDKPRLFLDAELFAGDGHNACFIDGATIVGRFEGELCRLTTDAQGRTFDDGVVRVRVDGAWRVLSAEAREPLSGPRSLRRAAELAVLYDGVVRCLPFLLVPPRGPATSRLTR